MFGFLRDGTDLSAGTSGRYSAFCDGIHDGMLVVKAAGFSDPNKVPRTDPPDIKILIRSSPTDRISTSPMEVRKIKRAYQWVFPTLDTSGGSITGQLSETLPMGTWTCAPEMFSDGICDCNCGRPDWDCFGSEGVPLRFVENELNDPGSPTTVRHNCPDGTAKLIQVPEITDGGGVPPTCGAIVASPQDYPYCNFKDGSSTA